MRQIQKDLHRALRAESIATRERLTAMIRPLDAAQLNEHPEPKGWSVGQVLEHLCRADELYEGPLTTLLNNTPRDAGAAAREWKSSFIGGLIAETLIKPRAVRGPKVFLPGATPRNGVVEEFLGRELRFVQAMDDAMPYDWRAVRIASPALPRWAPKMNLGDGFRIHVVHVTRHAKQIERLVKQLVGVSPQVRV